MAEGEQNPTGQGRFAAAKIAQEPDFQSRSQRSAQDSAKVKGVLFIVEMQRQRAVAIIGGVKNVDHDHFSDVGESDASLAAMADSIRQWARALGFGGLSIAEVDLGAAESGLEGWLAAGFHGDMDYMARHGMKRARPAELVPGTIRVISVRMDYSVGAESADTVLADRSLAYVSRYALGRDYHKVLRARLQKLADRICAAMPSAHRVFVDSAPVLEVELGTRGGLGWRGKHTLLLNRSAGSCFFLGEIFTDLPLPADSAVSEHCGQCSACLSACPTGAIVAPYRLDARRCISYLTIELQGAIPEQLRPLIGNRIYGCDDCQLACPWNRFAQRSVEPDFEVRNGLDCASLLELFAWTEAEFRSRTAGSPIHRIGHERWIRNIAVALGNADSSPELVAALRARLDDPSPLISEHVRWALAQHVQAV